MTAPLSHEEIVRTFERRIEQIQERYALTVSRAERDRDSGLAVIAVDMLSAFRERPAAAPVLARALPAPPGGRAPVAALTAPSDDGAALPRVDGDKSAAATRSTTKTPRRSRGGSSR